MRILIVSLKSQTEALLPKTLRGMRRSWDWAIAVQGDPRSVLLAKHLARRQTSPVGGLGLRSLWGRLIVSDAAEAESCAPFDRMSSLLAPIAGRAVQPNEVVPVHPAAQSVSEALEGKIRGRRFVLFLTRPRLPLLAWPEDHWRRLASHAARKGLLVVWAEPQPEDESGVSPREPRCESLSAFAGALSLGQIVELARRAAVCVGVDSVEFQAAAAAGAHVLALFGPSLPSNWGQSRSAARDSGRTTKPSSGSTASSSQDPKKSSTATPATAPEAAGCIPATIRRSACTSSQRRMPRANSTE